MRRFVRDKRGTSAVEFAILSPIYLVIFMGMVAYGIYFGASNSVQQLAADAARVSVAGLDAADRDRLARLFVRQNAGGYFFVDPAKVSVSVGDVPAQPGRFEVSLAYDASELPIWNLFGVAMPQTTIVRRSTVLVGGI